MTTPPVTGPVPLATVRSGPPDAGRARHAPVSVAGRLPGDVLWAVAVGVLALAARLFRYLSVHEIHIDEAAYADVSRNVATGEGLVIFGGPFHLHPPGYFLVLAAVQRLSGTDADRLTLIEQLRPVGATIGALTCVVVVVLLRRVLPRWAAVGAGLSLAIDPFANRWDSRVFLEAPAMLLGVLGLWCLVELAVRPAHRRPAWLLLAAGAAAAGAVLMKEPYAFLSVVPVTVLLVTGWCLTRRQSAVILGTTVLTYAVYPATIALTGQWPEWSTEKFSGVSRLVGLEHPTGFNAEGAESLTDRLVQNLVDYGASYAVVAVGGLSALAVVWWAYPRTNAQPGRRQAASGSRRAAVVIAVWTASSTLYVVYAVLFGTLEEQTFYLVLAPSVVSAAVAVAWVVRSGGRRTVAAVVVVVGVLLAGQVVGWTSIHSRTDDGYRQLDAWMAERLPPGTRVAVTEDTGQFVLEGVVLVGDDPVDGGPVVTWTQERVDLVLVSTELASRGYGTVDADVVARLDTSAPVVFVAEAPTLGELRLYDVRGLTGGSGELLGALDVAGTTP